MGHRRGRFGAVNMESCGHTPDIRSKTETYEPTGSLA